ncbi:MAG: thiamine pyrophosphate-binding protein [Candidatus Rokuibacteriota bacterium]
MAGREIATRAGARRIVSALEKAGVALVPSVPDTWIGWLMEIMRESQQLRVVDVAREEEAVAVACGAELVGTRAAVVIQNAGLLNCGAVIGSLVHLYRLPCFMLVSYRGEARDPIYYHAPKGAVTEPTLAAWRIPYARAAGPDRVVEQIGQGLEFVRETRGPFVLLFSAEDLA